MSCPQGRGQPPHSRGRRGAGEPARTCTSARGVASAAWQFTAVLCGHRGYQLAQECLSLPVTLPVAPGERSPLPKASVLPGPLDGSQELQAGLSEGSGLRGIGSLPVAAITRHCQWGGLRRFVSGLWKARCQEGRRPLSPVREDPSLLFPLLWFAGHVSFGSSVTAVRLSSRIRTSATGTKGLPCLLTAAS